MTDRAHTDHPDGDERPVTQPNPDRPQLRDGTRRLADADVPLAAATHDDITEGET